MRSGGPQVHDHLCPPSGAEPPRNRRGIAPPHGGFKIKSRTPSGFQVEWHRPDSSSARWSWSSARWPWTSDGWCQTSARPLQRVVDGSQKPKRSCRTLIIRFGRPDDWSQRVARGAQRVVRDFQRVIDSFQGAVVDSQEPTRPFWKAARRCWRAAVEFPTSVRPYQRLDAESRRCARDSQRPVLDSQR